MSPRRYRPITTVQAIVGTVAILAAVAVIVGMSQLLLLPQTGVRLLEAPEHEDEGLTNRGEVTCPSRENLARRPSPMPVSSSELIECPKLFDGEQVRYEGEAVGVVLLRPTHSWVHVNDDPYAVRIGPVSEHRTVAGGNSGMAVSMPRETAAAVTPGAFRTAGTGLSIVGTFLRADPDDGGAPSIRATGVRVVRDARSVHQEISVRRIVAAVVFVAVAMGLLVVRRVVRRRSYT
ncbi:MAG: hypothetical protein GEU74_09515 [Nitriliruptorales bacterium]|nr:hypothetical protein [Nitriliruptorales bacterium]